MVQLENIRETQTSLERDSIVATLSAPHPAAQFDPTDKRRANIYVDVVKSEVEETEIRIRFNRFELSLINVLNAIANEKLTEMLFIMRYLGLACPLIQNEYEKTLIYDYKHDEVYEPKALND